MAVNSGSLTVGGKLGYRVLASVSLVLALVGTVLPLLPTTPFALLAIWSAGRGSPALAGRIRQHSVLGPLIRDWHQSGSISTGAKSLACLMLVISAVMLWQLSVPGWAFLVFAVVAVGVALFVLSRPSPDRHS